MFSKIKLWFYGIGAAVLTTIAALIYQKGKKDAINDVEDDDYENAEDIRRRVSVDRADRVRKLDDAGWRD